MYVFIIVVNVDKHSAVPGLLAELNHSRVLDYKSSQLVNTVPLFDPQHLFGYFRPDADQILPILRMTAKC